MEEKDQKTLTVGDILDQLAKPSVIQNPEPPPLRPLKPAQLTPQPSVGIKAPSEVKLPSLGAGSRPSFDQAGAPLPLSEVRLSIRTMATDLARLRGDKIAEPILIEKKISPQPSVPVFKKPEVPRVAPLPPTPRPIPTPTPRPLAPSVSVPLPKPVERQLESKKPPAPPPPSAVLPALPPLPKVPVTEPEHHHQETILSTGDLPAYLGAPMPSKKPKKAEDEKVEFGVLAKIISSGMTTGIVATVIVSIALYFLISYLFFQEEQVTPIDSPTPAPSQGILEVNELEAIFKGIQVINFMIPQDLKQATPSLKTFIQLQDLESKEFNRILFSSSGQVGQVMNLIQLFDTLAISYPKELKEVIKDNWATFIYGQTEVFSSPSEGQASNKIIFISEVLDVDKATTLMKEWEATIAKDLSDIYDVDPKKESSLTFLDNDHDSIKIRYKNFPLPDKSIDYAIVSSLSGRHYLIITGSRETMFVPIDRIRGR